MNRRHSQRSSQAPPAAENQNQAVLRGVQMFDRLTDRIESGFEKLEKHIDDMRART
jgi:hypothetical protein